MTQCAHLFGKNDIVGVIVGDGGQDRGVRSQCNGGKLLALTLEAADQFGRKMLGITRRTPIAAGQYFAAGDQGLHHGIDRMGHRTAQYFCGFQFGLGAVFEMAFDAGLHIHKGLHQKRSDLAKLGVILTCSVFQLMVRGCLKALLKAR